MDIENEKDPENKGLYIEMDEVDNIADNNDTILNEDRFKNVNEIADVYPKNILKAENEISNNQNSTESKTKRTNAKIRIGNLIKEAFKAPLKKYIESLILKYKIKFNSLNWDQILGLNTAKRRRMLKLKVYQFICFDRDNKKKILSLLRNNKIPFPLLFYLTRTFEEIFTKYVNEDKIFVIKDSTTIKYTINNLSFPTLSQVIEEKKEEWKEKKTYSDDKVSLFEKISTNLIDDINSGKNERIQKNKKIFVIACEIKELEEKMKNYD